MRSLPILVCFVSLVTLTHATLQDDIKSELEKLLKADESSDEDYNDDYDPEDDENYEGGYQQVIYAPGPPPPGYGGYSLPGYESYPATGYGAKPSPEYANAYGYNIPQYLAPPEHKEPSYVAPIQPPLSLNGQPSYGSKTSYNVESHPSTSYSAASKSYSAPPAYRPVKDYKKTEPAYSKPVYRAKSSSAYGNKGPVYSQAPKPKYEDRPKPYAGQQKFRTVPKYSAQGYNH